MFYFAQKFDVLTLLNSDLRYKQLNDIDANNLGVDNMEFYAQGITNVPDIVPDNNAAFGWLQQYSGYSHNSNWIKQEFTSVNTGRKWQRVKSGGTWQPWYQVSGKPINITSFLNFSNANPDITPLSNVIVYVFGQIVSVHLWGVDVKSAGSSMIVCENMPAQVVDSGHVYLTTGGNVTHSDNKVKMYLSGSKLYIHSVAAGNYMFGSFCYLTTDSISQKYNL